MEPSKLRTEGTDIRQHTLTRAYLAAYARHLRALERSPGTVDNYLRAARAFAA